MTKLEQFDEQELSANPFSFSMKLPVTEVISNLNYTKDPEDGVIYNKSFFIESTQSIKIYYCEECKDIVYNLTSAAQRMYLYILYNLKQGKDYIQLNQEHYMKKNDITSVNTFKKAILELIRYGFITNTHYKSIYYINPNMFFSGNRLKKFPKNMEVVKTWEQDK